MALIPVPNGSKFALAIVYEAPVTVENISNALPAVADAAANGYDIGDILLLNNAWANTDNSVRRVSAVTADAFTLGGLDTTNTSRFPAGGGAGTARQISDFIPISKLPTFEMTGGDAKTLTTGYIDYERDYEAIIGANPERLNFTVSYQPDSVSFATMVKAHEGGNIMVMRMTLPNGDELFYPGQMFFNKTPVTTKDQEMVNNATIVMQGDVTRYPKLA